MQLGNLRAVWVTLVTCRFSTTGLLCQVTYGCMLDACVKCGHLEKAGWGLLWVFVDELWDCCSSVLVCYPKYVQIALVPWICLSHCHLSG